MKPENKMISLNLEGITKKFDRITALDKVSLKAKKGEIIALLGPNGAGKSTLMNIIAGYLAPDNGLIIINNKDAAKESLDTKRDIGFLPEGAPMYGDMTVRLFLKYMVEIKTNTKNNENLSTKEIENIVNKELTRVMQTAKVEDVANQKIETLSKGYLRRVGFAQSIIANPPILLLDEPTDGLDPNQKEHMRKLIKDMGKNKTIIISTHLLDEAETIADRIILINKGKIVIDGTLRDILSQTKNKTLELAFRNLTQTEERSL